MVQREATTDTTRPAVAPRREQNCTTKNHLRHEPSHLSCLLLLSSLHDDDPQLLYEWSSHVHRDQSALPAPREELASPYWRWGACRLPPSS